MQMMKCAVIGLVLLCCAFGFELTSKMSKSNARRQAPDDECIDQALSDGTVTAECIQAIDSALDDEAEVAAVCSSTCDSLYLAWVQCDGEEDTRQAYSFECTNGYVGPRAAYV